MWSFILYYAQLNIKAVRSISNRISGTGTKSHQTHVSLLADEDVSTAAARSLWHMKRDVCDVNTHIWFMSHTDAALVWTFLWSIKTASTWNLHGCFSSCIFHVEISAFSLIYGGKFNNQLWAATFLLTGTTFLLTGTTFFLTRITFFSTELLFHSSKLLFTHQNYFLLTETTFLLIGTTFYWWEILFYCFT